MPKINIVTFAVIIGALVVAALVLTRSERADVAQARGEVIAAQQAFQLEASRAKSALDSNKFLLKRADSAGREAARFELQANVAMSKLDDAKARRKMLPVPDTCANIATADAAILAASEALTETRTRELSAALVKDTLDRRRADEAETRLADLLASASRLDTASTKLVHASKEGFWQKLRPTPFVGAEVGIDPATKQFSKTVGVGLGWRF